MFLLAPRPIAITLCLSKYRRLWCSKVVEAPRSTVGKSAAPDPAAAARAWRIRASAAAKILIQRALYDGHQHRIVKSSLPAIEWRCRMRLRCRGINLVVERHQLRFRSAVVRAYGAVRQGGAEQQAAQSHRGGGSKVLAHVALLEPSFRTKV